MEDEALYGPAESETGPDLVPPSDDDDDETMIGDRQRKQTVVRALTSLDSLMNLGPLVRHVEVQWPVRPHS